MTTVYGIPDKDKYDEVICPKCENIQWEPKITEKFAWECRRCNAVIEDGKEHLLSKVTYPRFDRWNRRGSFVE